MKNKKSKKQLIEHVFLKIYLLSLIILILFVPFVNFMNNYNFEQFNNPLYAIDSQENLKTSDSGPLLSFYSFQIDDDNSGSSQGDNDGNIDAGETIELCLTLENTGDEDALNANATISSSNTYVTITNNFQNFITIQNGSTGISSNEEADELVLKLIRDSFQEAQREAQKPVPTPIPEKTKPFINEKTSEILVCISLIFGMVIILILLFIIW